MSLNAALSARSNGTCELCGSGADLAPYAVPPGADDDDAMCAVLCATCRGQIEGTTDLDVHHWRCLSESMWSDVPAIQILAWRMLTRLGAEPWARDLLDTLYLDDAIRALAEAGNGGAAEEAVEHRDSNGAVLAAGDTVTLIKDLNVKGAGFTAKRGTAVRNISLVQDNPLHIEGRVNGQQIVILTEFVKKSA